MVNIIKGMNGVVAEVIDGNTGTPLQRAGGVPYDMDLAKVDTFLDPTNDVRVGDAYDHWEVEYAMEGVNKTIITMLFILTNEVKILKSQLPLTTEQYKMYVKGLMA